MPTQFDKFLQQIVGEESGVIGILKCINQVSPFPFLVIVIFVGCSSSSSDGIAITLHETQN